MLVTKDYLKKEFLRSQQEETTPDCREHCHACFGQKTDADCLSLKEAK